MAQAADAEVQGFVDQVKPQIEAQLGKSFALLKAQTYLTQVVAGRNFFVKVQYLSPPVDGGFLHARIYVSFDGSVELSAVKLASEHDPIAYFEPEGPRIVGGL
eukprot:TRINITY_DN2355_c0_g1_i1.p1 TRINITY_DN2355_c0_g1~~TRINITY_DN2355_c0_g1_i1.p1  ORF type:complete len:112 (-),score=20.58 TRINITY_DN2355_c0_g1_i1:164-472(-)